MSGDGYRDPLGAAHARIGELEEKLATLEAEKAASKRVPIAGRFPELDAKVEALRIRSNDALNAQRRTTLTLVGILFPLASAVFSFLHMPVYATVASVIFIGLILLNLRNQSRQKSDKLLLVEAEKALANAHKIAELEEKLAEKEERVRVAAPVTPEAEPLSETESEDVPEGRALRS